MALCLGLLFGRTSGAEAEELRLRGDLPPVGESDSLNLDDLTLDEARALFDALRELLGNRMGSDVIAERDLYLGAIQGMLDQVNEAHRRRSDSSAALLPDAGMLLSQQQATQIRTALNGEVTGIGIEFQLHSREGILVVSRVLPGSPAQAAGLLAGDQILAIDGSQFSEASLEDVLSMLHGPSGSAVSFEFLRRGTEGSGRYAMSLARGPFSVESAHASIEEGGVGYLRIHQLHSGTPTEVEQLLYGLNDSGASALIIDLRDCAGGDLEAARALADLFVPDGTVLARLEEPGLGQEDLVAQRAEVFNHDIAILVNGWTRGAAELLSTALQEHGRAFVIGEPTLGKASSETLIDVGHSLVLRLESVRIAGPMGSSWQDSGVMPDQPIWSTTQRDSGGTDREMDLQFQTALHYLLYELPERPAQ